MLKKLFLPSLVLVSILAFSCTLVHAEEPPARSMLIKVDPNAPRTKGNIVQVESALELDRVELHDDGAVLTMELPPRPVPFDAYEIRSDMLLFVNQQFFNAGTPMQMTASIVHYRQTPEEQKGSLIEHRMDEIVAGALDRFRQSSRTHDLKILRAEELLQNGYPARRLTVQMSSDGQNIIMELLFITFKEDIWSVDLNFNANDKNMVNHAHNLLSSVRISEDPGKTAAITTASADRSSARSSEAASVSSSPRLREVTLDDHGYGLTMLLPFDIKKEFYYYALSGDCSLHDEDPNWGSVSFYHTLYRKNKDTYPSIDEEVDAELRNYDDPEIEKPRIIRRKAFLFPHADARRVYASYQTTTSDEGIQMFRDDILFITTDNEYWQISFSRDANQTGITDDMIDAMFASVRLHRTPYQESSTADGQGVGN